MTELVISLGVNRFSSIESGIHKSVDFSTTDNYKYVFPQVTDLVVLRERCANRGTFNGSALGLP
jgi:hypothetical protein